MKEKLVSKDYLEREFDIAVLEFELSYNTDIIIKRESQRNMKNLLELAMLYYGFDYADELNHRADVMRKNLGFKN